MWNPGLAPGPGRTEQSLVVELPQVKVFPLALAFATNGLSTITHTEFSPWHRIAVRGKDVTRVILDWIVSDITVQSTTVPRVSNHEAF